jgi:glycosyltransferase involved in cell wall biosynthesis
MRIVQIANSAWYLQNFRLGLAHSLREHGHEVQFISPRDGYERVLQTAGFVHHDWQLQADGTQPLKELLAVRRLRRLLAELEPAVAYSYTPKGNIYTGLALRGLQARFFPTVSGLGRTFIQPSLLTPLVARLTRLALTRAERVVFENEVDRSIFHERGIAAPVKTLRVHGTGVDLRRFAPAITTQRPAEQVEFLLVARLLWDKGVGEYVEAARRIRRDHPQVRFKLLGAAGVANPSAVPAEQLAAWLAEGAVEHLGQVDDVRPLLHAADCIVLPSYREGVPRSLMEGAAVGKPLIASDAPGCRDPVQDGHNGLLCQPRSADSLEQALRRFLALDIATRERMGRASRVYMAEQFDETAVVRRYTELLTA